MYPLMGDSDFFGRYLTGIHVVRTGTTQTNDIWRKMTDRDREREKEKKKHTHI